MNTIGILRAAAIITVAAASTYSITASASPATRFGQPFAFSTQMPIEQNVDEGYEVPANLKRQIIDYRTSEAPGTIVIDTPNTYLYLVLGNGRALRYGIGVGREGFTWAGTQAISRKAEWPDWSPPSEMIERQPYLPRFMAGGPGNPLGARAMYLGGTIYRIHGTNDPSTIGHRVSSGCIRMTNEDVTDLYSRVNVGTRVVVLPMTERRAAAAAGSIY
jgi:lipoprotein-anchoring transpeptidase ErfK/SrfK